MNAGTPSGIPPGRPSFFDQQTVTGLFAARNALLLIDPARLAATLGDDAGGARLLESFTARGRGPEICRDGLLVPAFGVEAGYYTVLVRSTETEGAFTPLTHIVYSAGFVLGTETGDLLVCNADHFREDAAPVARHAGGSGRAVRISPGWYRVTVVAGIRDAEEGDGEGWVCAFLLDPQERQPEFTADLSMTLSFFAG
jgi:hypothetical protein